MAFAGKCELINSEPGED